MSEFVVMALLVGRFFGSVFFRTLFGGGMNPIMILLVLKHFSHNHGSDAGEKNRSRHCPFLTFLCCFLF